MFMKAKSKNGQYVSRSQKGKSDKKSWDSFFIFNDWVCLYINPIIINNDNNKSNNMNYKFIVILLSGEEERSFQSLAELLKLSLYVTKNKQKKR